MLFVGPFGFQRNGYVQALSTPCIVNVGLQDFHFCFFVREHLADWAAPPKDLECHVSFASSPCNARVVQLLRGFHLGLPRSSRDICWWSSSLQRNLLRDLRGTSCWTYISASGKQKHKEQIAHRRYNSMVFTMWFICRYLFQNFSF